jgi:hypothetical protein
MIANSVADLTDASGASVETARACFDASFDMLGGSDTATWSMSALSHCHFDAPCLLHIRFHNGQWIPRARSEALPSALTFATKDKRPSSNDFKGARWISDGRCERTSDGVCCRSHIRAGGAWVVEEE